MCCIYLLNMRIECLSISPLASCAAICESVCVWVYVVKITRPDLTRSSCHNCRRRRCLRGWSAQQFGIRDQHSIRTQNSISMCPSLPPPPLRGQLHATTRWHTTRIRGREWFCARRNRCWPPCDCDELPRNVHMNWDRHNRHNTTIFLVSTYIYPHTRELYRVQKQSSFTRSVQKDVQSRARFYKCEINRHYTRQRTDSVLFQVSTRGAVRFYCQHWRWSGVGVFRCILEHVCCILWDYT